MSESQRALIGFAIIVCAFVALFAWGLDFVYPALTWSARILSPSIGIMCMILLFRDMRRGNEIPDFIRSHGLMPFERDGFFFALVPIKKGSTLVMQVLFQNGHARTCTATLKCKPGLGFWLQDLPLASISLELECAPGGAGVAEIPMAVPTEYQGKKVTYELGAVVRYPEGRGKRLLPKSGAHVGKPNFTTRSSALLSVFTIFTGFGSARPALFSFTVPEAVTSKFSEDPKIKIEYL